MTRNEHVWIQPCRFQLQRLPFKLNPQQEADLKIRDNEQKAAFRSCLTKAIKGVALNGSRRFDFTETSLRSLLRGDKCHPPYIFEYLTPLLSKLPTG